MNELLAKVAELLGAPENLVQRSAEARAEASGNTVDEVLQSWAGGESVSSTTPAAKEAPTEEVAVEEVEEEEAPVEEAPVEEIKEEVVSESTQVNVEQVIDEETVELKNESSLAFNIIFRTTIIITVDLIFLFGFELEPGCKRAVLLFGRRGL